MLYKALLVLLGHILAYILPRTSFIEQINPGWFGFFAGKCQELKKERKPEVWQNELLGNKDDKFIMQGDHFIILPKIALYVIWTLKYLFILSVTSEV